MADASIEAKVGDIEKRLQRERKMLEASKQMKAATTNVDVQSSLVAKIEQSERTISYFEESLRDLLSRASPGSSATNSSTNLSSLAMTSTLDSRNQRSSAGTSSSSGGLYSSRALPAVPGQFDGSEPTGLTPTASSASLAQPRQYSNLDLAKDDTPLTVAKVSRMVHLLGFKLALEKQYGEGLDKMAKLFAQENDKRSKADTETKRIESEKKIALLSTALRNYQTLNFMGEIADDEQRSGRAAPQTGKLSIFIDTADKLDRPPTAKRARAKLESAVVIKVDGTTRAHTVMSRTDQWQQDLEIHVDQANEFEVAIYDKADGSTPPIPVGVLWLRLSDIADELRRRKNVQETNAPGWVKAERVEGQYSSGTGGSGPNSGGMDVPYGQQAPGLAGMTDAVVTPESIEAWFTVEPQGRIRMKINFVKSNARKKAEGAGGLGRRAAVRKQKGEVLEQSGHRFVEKRVVPPVQCAYCRTFVRDASAMRCEDCAYLCHRRCYKEVVYKCVSKSSAETEKDEEKINHRIPHRFEPPTGFPYWCCHCGIVIGLGKKRARKCTECNLAAHVDCVHLVPDLCGMSNEMANQLLREVKQIKDTKTRYSSTQPPPQQDRLSIAPSSSQDVLSDQANRMRIDDRQRQPSYRAPEQPLNGDAFYATRPEADPRYAQQQQQYRQDPRLGPPQQQAPPSQRPPSSYAGGLPPGARPPQPPAPPPQQQQQARYDGYGQGPYPQMPSRPAPPQQQQQPTRQAAQPVQQLQQQQLAPLESPPRRSSSQVSPIAQQQLQQPVQQLPLRKRRVGLEDFNFLAVLGKGNFGKVMLAEERQTNRLYAIKVLKKDFIIENDEIESTKSEKRVFLAAARVKHPFLLELHSCFQTETRIYLCMEYITGGDLMLHIQREQFTPRRAKFYASEVLLALEFLHKCGIVYRDLKLDNILLSLEGHIKLADYGLCKEGMPYGATTQTFCGTPEFMAPEILLEQRYGRAVDWWAFGVLIYEMLLGQSPFKGDDEDEIFDAILEDEPLYPIHMPKKSVSILQKLLTRDPTRRLGAGPEDAVEIKAHPFFSDVNWDDVYHKRVQAPYLPQIKSATDTTHFDKQFTSEEPTLTPVHSKLTEADQREFVGFSYCAPWADKL